MQGGCLQCRRSHALAIHRVEAADGIAYNEESLRESAQLVVAAPHTGGVVLRGHLAKRFGGAERGNDPRRHELGCRWGDSGQIRGELVPRKCDPPEDYSAVFVSQQAGARGPFERWTYCDDLLVERAGRHPEKLTRVAQVDRVLPVDRPLIAVCFEKRWSSSRTPRRVVHQISRQYAILAGRTVDHPRRADAACGINDRLDDVMTIDERDVVDRPHSP